MSVSDKYRTDIDGLRAVAVVPVVLYHAGISLFSGGYVGVDVFFVISGYLITSLILPEIAESRFSFRSFYERRIRRLFPALFAVLLISCIPALWLLMPGELEDFGQSVATTTVFSSNFLFFSENGYFEGPAEQKPLLHTWSLAIEEQYYLIFPALLLLIRNRLGSQFQRWTLGLFAASLALSIYSVQFHPTAAFYLLPSRTWELLLGSLLAMGIIHASSHRGLNETLAWIGITLIAIAVFGYESTTPFPGLAALLPCAGTALLIYSGQQTRTSVAQLLSLRPLVLIGLISYSLYLWHWPVLVFAKHWLIREAHLWESLLLVALSVLLATLSWRYIEQPFRGKSGWFSQRALFRITGAVMLTLIAIGLLFDETEGLPGRLSPEVAQIAAYAEDKPPERKSCEGIDPSEFSYERLCRVTESQSPPSFIVWGDSHAGAVMRAARAAAGARQLNGLNATTNGCPPLFNVANVARDPDGLCMDYNQHVLELLKQHPEIDTIILMARWVRHAEAAPYKQESGELNLLRNQQRSARNIAQNREIYRQALDETLATLSKLQRRIIILGPVPEIGHLVPNSMAKATHLARPIELRLPLTDYQSRSAFTRASFAAALPPYPVTYVPVAPLFCDDQWCAIEDAGVPLYSDDDHLSSVGADRTIRLFGEVFDAAHSGDNSP
ncbi:MAG: acyltransferase family protein [Pseudomonadales bacterium]